MGPRRSDRRTQRTREAIRRAFVRLMLERGYESFNVNDITEAADIGRSTFYQHYSDKLALLRDSLQTPSRQLAAVVGADSAPEALLPQLLHFWDQRRHSRPFFSEPIRGVWVRVLAKLIEPRLAKLAGDARPRLPLSLAALQIAETQLSLVIAWLTGRHAVKPIEMAHALMRATHALTTALLER